MAGFFCVLEKFGFGRDFINWVKMVYAKLSGAVVTNDLISPFFMLFSCTKQGDLLSLLLFTLVEPLPQW